MENLDGKRVVITGGTSGIGLATAKLLLDRGARVLVTGRTKATLEEAAKSLGRNAIAVQSDAASLSDIEALADRVKAEFGTIDLLYVNAGVTRFVPFEGMTEQVYDEVMTVNAKGPYFTVQKLAPLIEEGGAVIVTTSVVNEMGYPMISAYSASKAALRSMVRSLARELLARGIRVNAVSPGPIETGILDRSLPTEAVGQTKQAMSEENPMKRFGRPEEVARAVAYLGFEATYTTGSELAVDGGGSQL
ncbi:SDR family oxidoreductase [Mesorhizobium sp.]|uniref:SDR family oxidoreductase n=1 Tax=Mesorhizobium sp. TaxID=1871066 RepID=UPI003564EC56